MKCKYAIFGRRNEWLMDIKANSEGEALALAMLETPYACRAIMVRPGGDLGTDGV